MSFSPARELRLATLSGIESWEEATGCDLTVDEPGGVTVELSDDIPRRDEHGVPVLDGTQAWGETSADRQHIVIHSQLSREDRALAIFHELGHALGGEHTETDGVLGGKPGFRGVVDLAALETVCSRLPCGWMRPEE